MSLPTSAPGTATSNAPLSLLAAARRHCGALSAPAMLFSLLVRHCSEVAGCKGFWAFVLDFRHFVQEDFRHFVRYFSDGADGSYGAYLNLSNVPIQTAPEVQAGTWTASTGQTTYMHWQAFDLTYEAPRFAARDAPQLAALSACHRRYADQRLCQQRRRCCSACWYEPPAVAGHPCLWPYSQGSPRRFSSPC